MKKTLLTLLASLAAITALVVGVGVVMPEAPVAGRAAEGAATLGRALMGDDDSRDDVVKMARSAIPNRTYYQYVDGNGRVQFAERLVDVPEPWRARAGAVQMSGPPPTTPGQAKAQRDAQAVAETTARINAAYGAPRVVVYSGDWNESSRKMIAWLDKKGYVYTNEDLSNPASRKKLLDKTGRDQVPCFEINGKIHRGFSPRRFKRLYKQAAGK